MKQVYRYSAKYILNDNCVIDNWTLWHYGELPAVEEHSLAWDDLMNHYDDGFIVDETLFSKKPIVRLCYSDYYVDKKHFKSAKVILRPVTISDYSVAKLATEMSANDFVEWCKDNGMTSIVIK